MKIKKKVKVLYSVESFCSGCGCGKDSKINSTNTSMVATSTNCP